MKFARDLGRLALLGTFLLPACSGRGKPTAPPGRFSLTGNVKLTGYLVETEGRFAGTRVVGDADGVPVELIYGNQVVARTTTVQGIYRFSGIAAGGYIARTRVIGEIGDETEVLTVASFDQNVADTLRLTATGDLYPVPNPFADTTHIFFRSPDAQSVDITITDMGGNPIRSLGVDTVYSGLKETTWDGLDHEHHAVSPGMYWVTFVSGDDIRAQILFKQAAVYERRRRGNAGPTAAVTARSSASIPGR